MRWIRRRRNRSEYDDPFFGIQEVTADLQHARNIVAAAKASL